MTSPQHLPKAPIVEAVLDIAATLPESADVDHLSALHDRLKGRYPTKQLRHAWTGRLEFAGDTPPVAQGSGGPIGYLFKSADGKNVVQARTNGFTFSRLRPYQTWEQFTKEAKDLWTHFGAHARPQKVTRIALRYINRLELPLPFSDFREYILTGPELAPGIPQGLGSFFFRVVVPVPEDQAVAIVTETIDDDNVTKTRLPLILDIDVFREGSFPVAADKLWPLFDPLRALKNRLFFASITEKTKELFT